MPFHLVTMANPFTPTERLKAHFRAYALEHAALDMGENRWREEVEVWRIDNEAEEECGYAWWLGRAGEPRVQDISIAVFDQFARLGAGSLALNMFEEQALRRGQVNSNQAETGLRVRIWLARHGFHLFDRERSPFWDRLSDAEYMERSARPVYFRKWFFADTPTMRRPINPQDHCEELHRNSAAVKCPMCMRVYSVNTTDDQEGRICPRCHGSKAFVRALPEARSEAWVEWPIRRVRAGD